jgi:hypothetical protein
MVVPRRRAHRSANALNAGEAVTDWSARWAGDSPRSTVNRSAVVPMISAIAWMRAGGHDGVAPGLPVEDIAGRDFPSALRELLGEGTRLEPYRLHGLLESAVAERAATVRHQSEHGCYGVLLQRPCAVCCLPKQVGDVEQLDRLG